MQSSRRGYFMKVYTHYVSLNSIAKESPRRSNEGLQYGCKQISVALLRI